MKTLDKFGVLEAMFLLRQYWPSSKKQSQTDEETDAAVNAWLRMLGEYPNDAVHKAIEDYAADGNKFPPRIGELKKALGEPQKAISAPNYLGQDKAVYDWYIAHKQRCHDAGIPTAVEARKQGIGYKEWSEMAQRVGI